MVKQGFNVVPGTAKLLAALGFLAACFGSICLGLAQRGPLQVVVLTLGMGLVTGFFVALYILAAGYVYGDARQRGMPPVLWTLLAVLVPNCIGFVLYFILRKPLLCECASCRSGIEPGSAFCPRCGAAQTSAPAVVAH